jgi:hypothetical protein
VAISINGPAMTITKKVDEAHSLEKTDISQNMFRE